MPADPRRCVPWWRGAVERGKLRRVESRRPGAIGGLATARRPTLRDDHRPLSPPWRSPSTKQPMVRWEKIWITGPDFARLAEAIPSVGRLHVPPVTEPPVAVVVREGRAFYQESRERLVRVV